MGVAGALNDNADITAPVYSYAPNEYGLYSMAGNVSEWVMDVYRPNTSQDADEFRPFRGNNFTTKQLDSEGNVADKLDYVVYNIPGIKNFLSTYFEAAQNTLTTEGTNLIENLNTYVTQSEEELGFKRTEDAMLRMQDAMDLIVGSDAPIASDLRTGFVKQIVAVPGDQKYRDVTVEENLNRRNYRVADNIDYADGEFKSSIYYGDISKENEEGIVYNYGTTSLINDHTRVYKGGSWADRVYWVIPGTRRYMDEAQSDATIGFRCAMTRVGSPMGNPSGGR